MGFGAGGGLRPEPRRPAPSDPSLEPSDTPALTAGLPRTAPPAGYRSPLAPGRLVRIFAVGTAAFAAVLVAYLRSAVAMVDQIRRDPLSVYQDDLLAVAQATVRVAVGLVLVQVVMTIFTLVWLRRLYRNLTVLGASGTRFAPGWAVGAWFVPFLNLARPKAIVDETWRKSDPELPDAFTAPSVAVPRLLHVWWAAWILATLLGVAARVRGSEVGIDAVATMLDIEFAGAVVIAASALLLERVVARLTMRHHDRAVRRGAAAPLARPWVVSPRGGAVISARRLGVILGPTVVAVAAVMAGTWTIDSTLTDTASASTGSGTSAEMEDLAVGDCFDLPPGQYVYLVSRVPCDEAHDAEFMHRVDLGDVGDPYPGEDAVTDRVIDDCLGAYADFIGVAYEDSTLDFAFLYPIELSWAAGNHEAQCFVVTVDGTKLVGSTRATGR